MTVDEELAAPPAASPFRETFDGFYRRELRPVAALAHALSGSRAAAEDLAQEGFVAAYRHWDRISGYDDPGAWVRREVANRAVSLARRRAAEVRALLRLQPAATEIAELPGEAEAVWAEVRRLPRRQAQVIALRYLDRRDVAGIAAVLDCSENTVKTHLARAKRTLAERLGGTFG